MNTTELTVTSSNNAFQFFTGKLEELKDIIESNQGTGGLSLSDCSHIKVPGAGAVKWNIKTASGEDSVQQLDGVILGFRAVRSYWSTSLGEIGGSREPDCRCDDYSDPFRAVGVGSPGGSCRSCRFSRFDDDGTPPACKQQKLLFFLMANDWLPSIVNIPPGSLASCRDYFRLLTKERIPCHAAITRLTLERTKNPSGIVYAKVAFALAGRLSAEETRQSKEFGKMFAALSAAAAQPEESPEPAGPRVVEFDEDRPF